MNETTVRVKITSTLALRAARERFANKLAAHYRRPASEITDDETAAWLARFDAGKAFLAKFAGQEATAA